MPSNRTLAISYSNNNPVSISSAMGVIYNGKFQAISCRISEMVRDRTRVTINH